MSQSLHHVHTIAAASYIYTSYAQLYVACRMHTCYYVLTGKDHKSRDHKDPNAQSNLLVTHKLRIDRRDELSKRGNKVRHHRGGDAALGTLRAEQFNQMTS